MEFSNLPFLPPLEAKLESAAQSIKQTRSSRMATYSLRKYRQSWPHIKKNVVIIATRQMNEKYKGKVMVYDQSLMKVKLVDLCEDGNEVERVKGYG